MRFDPEQHRVHESAAGLAIPFEHEHDAGLASRLQGAHHHPHAQLSSPFPPLSFVSSVSQR